MLLQTKLFMPQHKEGLIHRKALIDQLDDLFKTGLAILCAPAGYGKTTLVTQWLHNKQLNHCWVSLDSRDNDAAVFWQYITAAVAKLDERFCNLSNKTTPLDTVDLNTKIDALITALIDFSRTWKSPNQLALVLDDYHVISNPVIHAQLNHFINYAPDWIKFIVTARHEPELDLPRRRVRHQVTEINSQNLRFSMTECQHFLSSRLAIDLSETSLAMLHQKTEGWIAAVQLAGLSLQRKLEKDQFIKSFSGKETLLSSYLMSEIFELQPEYIQLFLLKLATVPRFCGELAEELTGHNKSQELISTLLNQNLLIVSLDNEGRWFRFHDLFREWLENQQQRSALTDLPVLREKAARWLEKEGFIFEALDQVTKINQWQWGSRLSGLLLPDLTRNGEFTMAASIANKFPDDVVQSQPKLCFMRALDYYSREQYLEARQYAECAEQILKKAAHYPQQSLADIGLTAEENLNDLTAICLILIRQIDRCTGKPDSGPHQTSDLHLKVSSSSDVYGWTLFGLGAEQFANNELQAAKENLLTSVQVSKQKNDPFCLLSALSWLAPTLYHLGEIKAGLSLVDELTEWLTPFNPEALPNYITLDYARVIFYIEVNKLDEAKRCHYQAKEKWGHNLEPLNQLYWMFQEFQLNIALKDSDAAIKALDELEHIYSRHFKVWQFVIPSIDIFRALIQLVHGKKTPICEWADKFEASPPATNQFRFEEERIVQARALVLQERDCKDLVESIRGNAAQNNIVKRLIICDLLDAYSLGSQGDIGRAIELFQKVLTQASEHGFVRLLVSEGEPVVPLLEASIQLGIHAPYAQMILDQINQAGVPANSNDLAYADDDANHAKGSEAKAPNEQKSLVDPLSVREIQVLKLIDEGNSNKVIAATLSVAPTTIKSHIRNIYSKLGVHRRTQALAIARSYNIL
ncbi:LuxR C-terminal-related transcriptional regulator [Alkalimarinus coralli]|uniref:LuxR C-terminal-related transcriptional regulator n=1 Tax=Alkalimarinus coralli TaxID=2935863 RepID=UPI00202B24B6|nr:LuxR C-terminal-related transcriptional regulator [Alkalimarinus coralli]